MTIFVNRTIRFVFFLAFQRCLRQNLNPPLSASLEGQRRVYHDLFLLFSLSVFIYRECTNDALTKRVIELSLICASYSFIEDFLNVHVCMYISTYVCIYVDISSNWSRSENSTRIEQKRNETVLTARRWQLEIMRNGQKWTNEQSEQCPWKKTTRAMDWCKFQGTMMRERYIFFNFFHFLQLLRRYANMTFFVIGHVRYSFVFAFDWNLPETWVLPPLASREL